jgi:hypothetical protein
MPILERRRFIALLAGASAGTAIALTESNPSIALASPLKSEAFQPQIITPPAHIHTFNPLLRLQQTSTDLAARPLNTQQADMLLNQLADWNVTRTDGILTDPSLLSNTYLLTNGPETTTKPPYDKNSDPLKHPVIQDFYTRYPDYQYSVESAERLLFLYYTPALGATPNSGIRESIINLDATNRPQINPQRRGALLFQYHGVEADPIKTTATPPIVLLSTGQHEWVHQDNWGIKKPLDQDLITFLEHDYKGKSKPTFAGSQDNFAVNYTLTNEDGAQIPSYSVKFNELITDFLSSEVLRQAGLPFFTGYDLKPTDYFNILRIMDQSGLNLQTLNQMYKHARLTDFYTAIASGAEADGKKTFSESNNNRDKIAFATKIMPWWDFPDWNPTPNDPRKLDPTVYYRGLVKAAA